MNPPATTALRELVSARIHQRFDDWAKEHPHLARAIDRTKMIESAVTRLRDDPEFQQALREADLNEQQLMLASRALEVVERWVRRVLTG